MKINTSLIHLDLSEAPSEGDFYNYIQKEGIGEEENKLRKYRDEVIKNINARTCENKYWKVRKLVGDFVERLNISTPIPREVATNVIAPYLDDETAINISIVLDASS